MCKLTTPELLKKLHKLKMSVSHDQLKYWRRNGLLPKPIRRGKGRGKGIEQLWDEACIENIRFIKESSNGKRINLNIAGKYLFARNMPIGVALLQRRLLEIPYEMRENEKQRAKNSSENPELAELIEFLTPAKVNEAIKQIQTTFLIDVYKSIKKFESLTAKVAWISNCQAVFDVLVETQFPDLTYMNSASNEAFYRRQRSLMAWAVLIHYYGDDLFKMANGAIEQILFPSMSNEPVQPIVWPKL